MSAANLPAPAPASLLDLAADCIDAGDEIGRLVYLRAHAAGVAFAPSAPVALETIIRTTGRGFSARYAGTCAVSGERFNAGATVYRLADGSMMSGRIMSAWDFRMVDGDTSRSGFVRVAAELALAVAAALESGKVVTVLPNSGHSMSYKMERGMVTPCSVTGKATWNQRGRVYKSIAAWWTVAVSRAQALRVEF